MPRLDVLINGRHYPVGCDEGQEARVRELAAYIDRRIAELKDREADRSASEPQLLVLASLLVADELFDLRNEAAAADPATEASAAAAIGRLASRVEAIAARLEQP